MTHLSLALLIPVLVSAWSVSAPTAEAQQRRIRVSVNLGSDGAGPIFASIVKGALRNLGDVDVVSSGADYVLDGVLLCNPKEKCEEANSYTGSIRLYSPISRSDVDIALVLSGLTAPDSTARKLLKALEYFEVSHQTWTINYGRNVYERAMREFVTQIDTTCFEKFRIMDEISRMPAKDQSAAYGERIMGKRWNC